MIKIMKKTKIQGIGLIELLLLIALGAVILVASIQYYDNAQISSKINQTVDDFHTIKAAVLNFRNDRPTENADLNLLVINGYLPQSFEGVDPGTGNKSYQANVWGGGIEMGIQNGLLSITFNGMPSQACSAIEARLESTINSAANEQVVYTCDSKVQAKNSVTAYFEI